MNKTLSKTLVAGALALAGLSAHAVGTLTLTPASTLAHPGDSFVLELRGTGFNEETLGGGVDLSWNPAVIDLDSVVIDATAWEFNRNAGLLDPASGTLSELRAVTFSQPKMGDFLIARLTFIADQPGTTQVTVGPNAFQPFSNTFDEPISLSFSGAQVTVTAVPEPGTWALMALGLAGLPWLRRRTRSASH